MSKLKATLLASLIAVGPLVASPAFAGWEYWNGSAWVNTTPAGTYVTITGSTTATVSGIAVPCSSATFNMQLASGVASIASATFTGGSACTGNVTAENLSWGVSPGVGSGATSSSVTIGGASYPNAIQVRFNTPARVCTGGVATGTLNNLNNTATNATFTFTAQFLPAPSPCTNVRSTSTLTANAPLRFM
ncbi:hypothetical protein [Lysobacter sp. cf310]|uniref:hypothetical protein n=1 Tax=Lysobacter sp. cf310 TaxID=1761790 RepID=UPI0008E4C2A6|nr:hypothetical protein [Lysobacter sp. cf310]SFL24773.1 hypothetical protein SAMN04487938_3816 [Lysobacter sp. cf310]